MYVQVKRKFTSSLQANVSFAYTVYYTNKGLLNMDEFKLTINRRPSEITFYIRNSMQWIQVFHNRTVFYATPFYIIPYLFQIYIVGMNTTQQQNINVYVYIDFSSEKSLTVFTVGRKSSRQLNFGLVFAGFGVPNNTINRLFSKQRLHCILFNPGQTWITNRYN